MRFIVGMLPVSFLLGKAALRLLYGSRNSEQLYGADAVITGWMILTGLAEMAHLGMVAAGRSFCGSTKLFTSVTVVLVAVALVFLLIVRENKDRRSSIKDSQNNINIGDADNTKIDQNKSTPLMVALVLLIVLQLLLQAFVRPTYLDGDMTVETVNSILTTDTAYQVNPLTGQPYALGVPLRIKILGLPSFYAMMCRIFRMDTAELVWTWVPVFTWILAIMAFYSVAKALFPKDKKKQQLFLLFTIILLSVSGYLYGMEGFALQYAGYRGTTLRLVILLPYTISLLLRQKYRVLPLCILVEACIVWTLYGMGYCLLVTVGMMLVSYFVNRQKGRKPGEEAAG